MMCRREVESGSKGRGNIIVGVGRRLYICSGTMTTMLQMGDFLFGQV